MDNNGQQDAVLRAPCTPGGALAGAVKVVEAEPGRNPSVCGRGRLSSLEEKGKVITGFAVFTCWPVAEEEPLAPIATNKQQNSAILFLQINLVVKDQITDRYMKFTIRFPAGWMVMIRKTSICFSERCGGPGIGSAAPFPRTMSLASSLELLW